MPVPCTPATMAPATVAHTEETLVPVTLSVVKKQCHKCVQDTSCLNATEKQKNTTV